MISDRARGILSEEASDDGEQTVIFLEEGPLCCIFRLFRASEGAGDPEEQATRWLERARSLCRTAHGELRTGVIPSNGGEYVMAAVSGREIEAREWTEETDDRSSLSTTHAAR